MGLDPVCLVIFYLGFVSVGLQVFVKLWVSALLIKNRWKKKIHGILLLGVVEARVIMGFFKPPHFKGILSSE